MEPVGSGATWTGNPKGVFAGRKHHKPRLALNNNTAGVCEREDVNRTRVAGHLDEIQGVAASTVDAFRGGAVGFIEWLDDLSLLSRIVLLKNLHLIECDNVMDFPPVICAAARMRLLGRRPLRDEDDF
jgi:hypothetical protein